jgi:hypothetical protein
MVVLIGIDCATQPRKVGLALGRWDGRTVRVLACCIGNAKASPLAIINGWLQQHGNALIALDAPLGWPQPLGDVLNRHQAGAGMGYSSNRLFRRHTDDAIQQRFGKRPLEVGANFISRTAVAALELLEQLRQSTGDPIPLAWSPEDRPALAAIEVYPAATRLSHGSAGRGGSIEALEHRLDCSALNGELPTSADAIDALVCLVAAADFLEGRACPPDDLNLAKTEGWIWTAESTEPGVGGEHC